MEPVPQKPQPSEEPLHDTAHPVIQTYQSDMARAMDATDAAVVQELIQTARDKEADEEDKVVVRHKRKWYTAAGIILLILALAAIAYGFFYFKHLTVGVTPAASVGIFQSTDPIFSSTTSAPVALDTVTSLTSLPVGKPFLVPIDNDPNTLTPLTSQQVLDYLGIHADEPLVTALSLIRLGVLNTGTTITPFLIASTPEPDVASKELLLAEPNLLSMVAPTLRINLTNQANEVGTSFTSSYMYNLPVRTLKTTNLDTGEETIMLYYGYATQHTIVIATDPTVLKAVYDTVIQQH